jgi:hypothetical protein
MVQRSMIFMALAVLALSAPAVAQSYPPGAMPPYEILSMLRSTGFDPIGQPVRRGPNYMLRAIDENDREVNVVINARSGGIVSVTPIQTASRVPPPPPGVSMGPYERMPPGYVPPSGPRGYGAPLADDDDDALPPPGFGYNAPRPPGAMPGALPRSSNAPPLSPRGGAVQQNDDDEVASLPSTPGSRNVITADPDRSGMLPPPPERFPQRAAPAAPPKPKPVTRAAAAPPKAAPLPKPKPGATADAPPAPPLQAWPSTPEPARAPAKSPAAEETPN